MDEIIGDMIDHGRKKPTLDWVAKKRFTEGMTFE